MFKDLQFRWVSLPKENEVSNQFYKGYFDFIASDQSLIKYFGFKNSGSVTPFGYFPSNEELNRVLKEFRLQIYPQLPGNRIELYICECCGDIGCGSITAKIADKGKQIIWSQFAHQSDPDQVGEEIDVEEIEFDKAQYFKAFSEITSRLRKA